MPRRKRGDSSPRSVPGMEWVLRSRLDRAIEANELPRVTSSENSPGSTWWLSRPRPASPARRDRGGIARSRGVGVGILAGEEVEEDAVSNTPFPRENPPRWPAFFRRPREPAPPAPPGTAGRSDFGVRPPLFQDSNRRGLRIRTQPTEPNHDRKHPDETPRSYGKDRRWSSRRRPELPGRKSAAPRRPRRRRPGKIPLKSTGPADCSKTRLNAVKHGCASKLPLVMPGKTRWLSRQRSTGTSGSKEALTEAEQDCVQIAASCYQRFGPVRRCRHRRRDTGR